MDLYNYLRELFREDEFIDEHYKGQICIKLPENYEDIPQLLSLIDGHTILDIEKQKEYFQKIKDKELKINCINGDYPMLLSGVNLEFTCDICGVGIRTSEYYYCNECYLDICHNCYNNKQCLEHPIIQKTSIRNIIFYCSLCHRKIDTGEERFSDLSFYGTDYETCICLECSKGFRGSTCIVNNELSKHNYYSDKKDYANFGSFLDWIPVIEDEYHNMVLVNWNKDSEKFRTVCLVSSNVHNQKNYFTMHYTLDDIISLLINDDILSYKSQSSSKNWINFFLSPIKKIMLLNNLPVYQF